MSDDKQRKEDPSGYLYEESSVIMLLESAHEEAAAETNAANDADDSKQAADAAVNDGDDPKQSSEAAVDDGDDSKQAAEAEITAETSPSRPRRDPPEKTKKLSASLAPSTLERSTGATATSQPGAFPVAGTSSPETSLLSQEVPPLPPVNRQPTEFLVSAELVDPTHVADVEVGRGRSAIVEAEPIEDKVEQPLRLIDLWKNRTVRIIVVVVVLVIVGLIVGLVVGLQNAEVELPNNGRPPPESDENRDDNNDEIGDD
jgi:hypothetical protein